MRKRKRECSVVGCTEKPVVVKELSLLIAELTPARRTPPVRQTKVRLCHSHMETMDDFTLGSLFRENKLRVIV